MQPHASGGSEVRSPPLWRQLQQTARLVQGVLNGQSLASTLNRVPADLRSGVQALTFLVLRHLGLATAVRAQLASRRPPPEADALLCTGIALLWVDRGDRYPTHTLADQLVEAAKRSQATRAQAGLINACIRRLLRERDQIQKTISADQVAQWNYPLWWIERVQADQPDAWQPILEQGQSAAPMVLRVNQQRESVEACQAALVAAGLGSTRVGAQAIQLARFVPVSMLPGFSVGNLSVQSAAAQLAAPLLMADLGVSAPRVLDACAAPGGKTAHMLEMRPDAQMTALEADGLRAERIVDTLGRLGLRADIKTADAAKVSEWWDGMPFDRIMLDAPCSASGIVRRHPDIRWLRRPSDLPQLAALQDQLLDALWPVLVPGGRLLYATCSIFRQEGVERIEAFLARQSNARLLPSPGHLLPAVSSAELASGENVRTDDGFFYALLEKRPD